jgi:heptosyltransferase-2/heptosyltransferase-3
VLLLRPDHIGDVLLSAPAVALLRASLPLAHLTYLVGPWSGEAARRGPPVDSVRTLAYPGFARRSNANVLEPYALLLRVASQLRREHFDLAVVLRGDHWWGALLALVAGIPLRVGGATPETDPLLSHSYRAPGQEPWGEQALGIARLAVRAADATVVEPIHVRQFRLSESAQVAAGALWRQHGLGERVVVLHPSAGAPLKSWPTRRWAELAGALLETGLQVVLVGAPDDRALLGQVAGCVRGCAPVLCGQSLEISAAVYARCGLVVTVDSGAGHLAAAVGARTVRLYGPAPSNVFGPWPPDDASQHVLATKVLACAPCGYLEAPPCGAHTTPACMLALGVDDVMNAVRRELDRS